MARREGGSEAGARVGYGRVEQRGAPDNVERPEAGSAKRRKGGRRPRVRERLCARAAFWRETRSDSNAICAPSLSVVPAIDRCHLRRQCPGRGLDPRSDPSLASTARPLGRARCAARSCPRCSRSRSRSRARAPSTSRRSPPGRRRRWISPTGRSRRSTWRRTRRGSRRPSPRPRRPTRPRSSPRTPRRCSRRSRTTPSSSPSPPARARSARSTPPSSRASPPRTRARSTPRPTRRWCSRPSTSTRAITGGSRRPSASHPRPSSPR